MAWVVRWIHLVQQVSKARDTGPGASPVFFGLIKKKVPFLSTLLRHRWVVSDGPAEEVRSPRAPAEIPGHRLNASLSSLTAPLAVVRSPCRFPDSRPLRDLREAHELAALVPAVLLLVTVALDPFILVVL